MTRYCNYVNFNSLASLLLQTCSSKYVPHKIKSRAMFSLVGVEVPEGVDVDIADSASRTLGTLASPPT